MPLAPVPSRSGNLEIAQETFSKSTKHHQMKSRHGIDLSDLSGDVTEQSHDRVVGLNCARLEIERRQFGKRVGGFTCLSATPQASAWDGGALFRRD